MNSEESTSPATDPDESAWLASNDEAWFGPYAAPEIFEHCAKALLARITALRDELTPNIGSYISDRKAMYDWAYRFTRSLASVIYVGNQIGHRSLEEQATLEPLRMLAQLIAPLPFVLRRV